MPSKNKKQDEDAEAAAEAARLAHAVRTEPHTVPHLLPRTIETPDLYGPQPNPGYVSPASAHGLHPEQSGYLTELAAAAHEAQHDAQGASETLYRVARGEEAYPDPEATAKAVIALAQQVNTLTDVVFELVRMVRHDDIASRSKGLPH